jgi:hypothetical protein
MRGVLLYALCALLLVAGGWWFFAAAPPSGVDPRLAGWQDAATNLLPDLPFGVKADTIVMAAGASAERNVTVTGGSYSLSMVCLGDHGDIRVRLSSSGDDSGRAVPCADSPETVSLPVALADAFYLEVSAETGSGTAVFRWRLDHAHGF